MMGVTRTEKIEKMAAMMRESLSKFGSVSIPLVVLEELAGRFKNSK